MIQRNEIQENIDKNNVHLKKLYFTAVKIEKVVFHRREEIKSCISLVKLDVLCFLR